MNKSILKITLIVVLPLILAGCFGGGDDNGEDRDTEPKAKIRVFETGEFSVDVPFDWEVITPKDFTSEVPPNTTVAFRNNVKNANFTANLTVVHNTLPSSVSSVDHAKGLLQRHVLSLVNFSEISRTDVEVPAGGTAYPSLLVVFQGKESEDSMPKEFLQMSVVKGKEAYIITGAYLIDENQTVKDSLVEAIKSLKVK